MATYLNLRLGDLLGAFHLLTDEVESAGQYWLEEALQLSTIQGQSLCSAEFLLS
jgi:hypothetical protein